MGAIGAVSFSFCCGGVLGKQIRAINVLCLEISWFEDMLQWAKNPLRVGLLLVFVLNREQRNLPFNTFTVNSYCFLGHV